MYDRAVRESFKPVGSTGGIGPGAYETEFPSKAKLKADGYAPFQSMTSRETYLHINDTSIAAPGPGQYDPGFVQYTVKGGRTLANKSKRFSAEDTPVPGPGAYAVQKEQDWLKSNAKSFKHFGEKSPSQMMKGALVTNRIKFNRMPEAPSIPTPGQAYGFEENEDGTLRKQDAPDKDKSIGPAYYAVNTSYQAKPTRHYKGIHFGNRTSKRIDFVKSKEGPGPGEYEAFNESQIRAAENANFKEEQRQKFEAKIPRYHEYIEKRENKKAVPGPGKYEVKGDFDSKPAKVNIEGIEIEHPPFMSQSKRFGSDVSLAPAPGSYNDPRQALESLKKVSGLKRSPFGQTAVRFQPQHQVRKTPGPGSYNHMGLAGESMRKAYIESTRRGVFGTTSMRVQPLAEKERAEVPGPGQYQIKEKPFVPRYQQLSANFSSLTQRLVEVDPLAKEMPPPGSYEVHASYSKSQHKKNPAPPRNKEASRRHNAFQMSASRFEPPRNIKNSAPDPVIPGPGAYTPGGNAIQPAGGLMTSKDRRFRMEKIDETPGPGAYEFSPLVQDTVLKGTFNSTLNNPVTPQVDSMRVGSTAKHAFLLGV